MGTGDLPKLMTAEEFMEADLGEGCFELVLGEPVRVQPTMPLRGLICANVAFSLDGYGRSSGRGYVLMRVAIVTDRDPDTVRGPDLSFYSEERWPRSQVGETLPPIPPDLVVEVGTPGRRVELIRKLVDYLRCGISLIWYLNTEHRFVAVFRPDDGPPLVFQEGDRIECLPELPGFSCPVSDFLP